MKKVIILAAGKPHYGSKPTIFFNQNKYFNNFDILKKVLSNYSNKITVITGYKHKYIRKTSTQCRDTQKHVDICRDI